jgi:hypothetical protein
MVPDVLTMCPEKITLELSGLSGSPQSATSKSKTT